MHLEECLPFFSYTRKNHDRGKNLQIQRILPRAKIKQYFICSGSITWILIGFFSAMRIIFSRDVLWQIEKNKKRIKMLRSTCIEGARAARTRSEGTVPYSLWASTSRETNLPGRQKKRANQEAKMAIKRREATFLKTRFRESKGGSTTEGRLPGRRYVCRCVC